MRITLNLSELKSLIHVLESQSHRPIEFLEQQLLNRFRKLRDKDASAKLCIERQTGQAVG